MNGHGHFRLRLICLINQRLGVLRLPPYATVIGNKMLCANVQGRQKASAPDGYRARHGRGRDREAHQAVQLGG